MGTDSRFLFGYFGSLAAGVLILAVTALPACRSINPLPTFGVGDAHPEETLIRDLMKWHSGRVEVYRDFRTVFTARAVFLSNEIQGLALDWEARSKLMTPEERAAFEKRFLGRDEGPVKILVGFYTPVEKQNDLSREDSIWTPYLSHPDGSVTKASCIEQDETNSRVYMRFLEWDLSWSKLYLFCFPASLSPEDLDNGWINLVISGPEGQGTLRLRAVPPENKP